ncbi:MAG: sulfide dehydrogenase [Chlorobiaceae bacterium]|nr:sulfide dehydrogenase [Chlorobiaceae bacterium]NTW62534.1 sulfide dehydrogenase [Chlorobiaceae bacterium]
MRAKLRLWLTFCVVTPVLLLFSNTGMAEQAAATKVVKPVSKAVGATPRGQVLSLSCSSCHGTDGKSVGIMPSFYGKTPQYIETALLEFKSGKRYSTVMGRHAKGYSDDEIHLIAQYCGTVGHKTK